MTTTLPLSLDTDWELFAGHDEDDDGNISFEEINVLDELCSVPNLLNYLSCIDDTQMSDDLYDLEQQNEIDNSPIDEFINLQDSYEGDATSTQSTSPSSNLTPHHDESSSPSPPIATPQIPEFDQLPNLPYEIVERSRYLSLVLR
jgi:hypothetical protein